MLIALSGGICTGKGAMIEYLVTQHDFIHLRLSPLPLPPHNLSSDDTTTTAELCFLDAERALEYVLKNNWQTQNYVLSPIERVIDAISVKGRPFTLLVSIEAPTHIRYIRYKDQCLTKGRIPPSLEEFLTADDQHIYGFPDITSSSKRPIIANHLDPHPFLPLEDSTIYKVSSNADLHILNNFTSLFDWHAHLSSLCLTSLHRLRPSWDEYFMRMSDLAARRSNCMKRRVGCILVKENRVLATGYNGTPRGVLNCNEGGCPRCNDGAGRGIGLDECLCLHAEENALLEAGKMRVENGGSESGAILYCNTCPCLGCAKKIIQVGVREVVFSLTYGMDDLTERLLSQAGVKLRQFSTEGPGRSVR